MAKDDESGNRRELWLQFLNAETEEDFVMLEKTNDPVMKKAVNIIYDMSEDTRLCEIARLREKALHDEASALYSAKQEGMAQREIELINKMRDSGMSEEQIKMILNN